MEIVTIQEKLRLIKANFGRYKLSGSEKNASVVCASCLDSGKITDKKKLSICLNTGIYHCWVCEAKGKNIGSLALKYSRDKVVAKKLKQCFGNDSLTEDEEIEADTPRLPDDFKLMAFLSSSKVFKYHYQYLVKRGFCKEKMLKFRIGVSGKKDFKDRVIFPSFNLDQSLNYYVTRTIDNDTQKNFRYKNSKNKRKDVIFRHVDLNMKKELILVEGVFDLVNCPDNSTCLLGSWLGEDYELFKQIIKNKTSVILCLDPDAREKSLKIAKKLHSYCISVKITQNMEKDFGSMTEQEVNYYLSTAKQYDNADRIGYLINEISSGSIF
tara:strand:- start:3115 stop:4089 length:975 start_codon:yes stop_codon:yes gene_type:complete